MVSDEVPRLAPKPKPYTVTMAPLLLGPPLLGPLCRSLKIIRGARAWARAEAPKTMPHTRMVNNLLIRPHLKFVFSLAAKRGIGRERIKLRRSFFRSVNQCKWNAREAGAGAGVDFRADGLKKLGPCRFWRVNTTGFRAGCS